MKAYVYKVAWDFKYLLSGKECGTKERDWHDNILYDMKSWLRVVGCELHVSESYQALV